MRVLITGATGFIGSHVTRLLVREGCEVFALIRPGSDLARIADIINSVQVIQGDIFCIEEWGSQLKTVYPDVCIHLAWYAEPGKALQSPLNLACLCGSLRLLEALEPTGYRRMVLAGTAIEYDTALGPVNEDSPINPRTLYAACKYALFLAARELERHQGRSLAVARIFNVYGPWEDQRRLVPHVIRKLLAGEPCDLTRGDQIRDYLHVEDVATAIWKIARSQLEGAVNVASSQPISVASLAEEIGRLLGRTHLLRPGALPSPSGDPALLCSSSDYLRTSTDWRPAYEIRSGLRQTIAWWKTHMG